MQACYYSIASPLCHYDLSLTSCHSAVRQLHRTASRKLHKATCSYSRAPRAAWLAIAAMLLMRTAQVAAQAPPIASPPAIAPPAASTAASDPLLELNLAFRAAYTRHRAETLATAGPVIVVSGDDLVLINEGRRTQVRFSPDLYHVLKTYSHVPLALHVILVGRTDQPLDDAALAALQNFKRLLAAARDRLAQLSLAADARRAQQSLCDASMRLIDEVLAGPRIGESFFGDPRRMHRDLLADAAAEYLKSWPSSR